MAENDDKVVVIITSPVENDVVSLADLPVSIKSTFGLPAFVDLTVNKDLVFEKQSIGPMETITLTVPKAKLAPGKNTLQAEAYYMMPNDDKKYGAKKTEKITINVIVVAIIRNAPTDPCLTGSAINFKCEVSPSDTRIDSFDWRYALRCCTAPSDPCECPEQAGHNLVGNGPQGTDAQSWITDSPGPLTAHAGVHTVTCKILVDGHQLSDSITQNVEPRITLKDVAIVSPAADGSWPYDPVWHDTDWAPTVTGAKAVSCSTDSDLALVKYTLNKTAGLVRGTLFKDTLGAENVVVVVFHGCGKQKGPNVIPWTISTEDDDQYFAEIWAQGTLGFIDSSPVEESSNCTIHREFFYTTEANSFDSYSSQVVWKYSEKAHNAIIALNVVVAMDLGKKYLVNPAVWDALRVGTFAALTQPFFKILQAPEWMEEGTRLYYYGPWPVKTFFWFDGAYRHGLHPDLGAIDFRISAFDAYDSTVDYPPPLVGVHRVAGTPQFEIENSGDPFSAEEMQKTPWMFTAKGLGLLPPALIPVATPEGE